MTWRNAGDDPESEDEEIFKEEFAAHAAEGREGGGPRAHFAQMKEALESFKTPNFDAAQLLPDHPQMGEKIRRYGEQDRPRS